MIIDQSINEWFRLIKEFAVGVGSEEFGTRFRQHLTGNHFQSALQSIADTNASVEGR